MTKKALFITGASGFIGSRLSRRLLREGRSVKRGVRRAEGRADVLIEDLGAETNWSKAVEGIDSVIHLAARVHVMKDSAREPLAEFRRVNTEGTANLARQAAAAGVRRFVFVSSVKVNGEATLPGQWFRPEDDPAPLDPYAVSKAEAEQALLRIGKETGLEVIVIRPPLVYGPGVRANFLRLMQAVHKGLPLPIGMVRNKRSLVALDNLVDLIITTLMISGQDLKKF